jgi:hypothetical protein
LFISQKVFIFLLMASTELPQQRTMIEDTFRKSPQRQRGKLGILFPDKVLVEPVSLFYLEADSRDADEFFGGDVDDEATSISMEEEAEDHERSSRTSWKEAV